MGNLIGSDVTDSSSARSNVIRFFYLNNEPEDETRQFRNNEVVKLNENEENIDRNSFEPFVGQCCLSEEEAYLFYENFAKDNGFSIRREWHVTQFNSHHNHQLLSATQVRFLPSYLSISKDDEQQLMLYKNVGLSVSRKRQENLANDAMDLLKICKSAKTENPNFPFDFTIDNENRLENIFWSPTHCFDLYQEYGDSSGFDTTYRTFVTLMKKPPMTLITDQDPWMSKAVSIEMLYKLDNIDDFEQEWPLMIDLAVGDIGQTQLHHTKLDTYRGSCLRTSSSLEEQVYKVFTSFSFKKFQEEFERANQYTVCLDHTHVFIVRHYKELRAQKHNVVWNCDNISCSCKLFEFWGILCRHVLSVFIHKDRFDIPVRYLPLRWCRDEFHTRVIVPPLNQTISNSEVLSSEIINLGEDNHIHNPPVSKTKGRPKFRREIGEKEAAQRQSRNCSFSKKPGHKCTTRPEKENIHVNTVPVDAKKRKKDS
ncbi:protein FAR1-RELATED SEQUENCE 11-like [Silene latifolia]|uniref:protein FAR1-RELATED SEQUENCE 11-like n=1 Tax=Silene latifolia TaxID=37657 RepID=UPI003D76DC8E